MAPSAGTLRVGRYFAALLALLVLLYAIVFWPHQRHTPKLGLDLQGGGQVVLQAKLDNGKTPSTSAMNQARTILTNRVNARGVSNAEVVQQGSDRIVISVPGKQGSDLKDVSQAALLEFRPLLQQAVVATLPVSSGSTTPSSSTSTSPSAKPVGTAKPTASAKPATPAASPTVGSATTSAAAPTVSQTGQGHGVPLAAGSNSPAASGAPTTSAASVSPAASASSAAPATAAPTSSGAPATSAAPTSAAPAKSSASPTASAAAGASASSAPANPEAVNQWAKLGFAPPTTAAALTALNATQAAAVQAVVTNWKCQQTPKDVPTQPLVTCDQTGQAKYLLAPVVVQGKQVSTAAANAPDGTSGFGWSVSLTLKSQGQSAWSAYTAKHNEQVAAGDVANIVAFTLDARVITAPTIQSTINGDTQITGTYTQTSANQLADSLKYGALPLNFTEETATNISATLGSDQLKAGLLAGGIGLLLVVVYSMFYYRALGIVTIASLLVSAALTYGLLVLLGTQINFTLTLAGIAGFIVAVGITADSFVVFFERIKDEVHEGRSARVGVPRAWIRARRTIISADTVSLLAALILYYFAAGEVRGFAFTLGMSTLLDLIVVFLFTHPLVSLLSRSQRFGSARWSGLNSLRTPRPDLAYATVDPAFEPAFAGAGYSEEAMEETPAGPPVRMEKDSRSASTRSAAPSESARPAKTRPTRDLRPGGNVQTGGDLRAGGNAQTGRDLKASGNAQSGKDPRAGKDAQTGKDARPAQRVRPASGATAAERAAARRGMPATPELPGSDAAGTDSEENS